MSAAFAGPEAAGPPGVGHFRLDIGVGLEEYPGDDYRQTQNGGGYNRAASQHAQAINGGQFGILAPTTVPGELVDASAVAHGVSFADMADKSVGKAPSKIVPDPPDLAAWRDKLFNVDEMIVLTHDQYGLDGNHSLSCADERQV